MFNIVNQQPPITTIYSQLARPPCPRPALAYFRGALRVFPTRSRFRSQIRRDAPFVRLAALARYSLARIILALGAGAAALERVGKRAPGPRSKPPPMKSPSTRAAFMLSGTITSGRLCLFPQRGYKAALTRMRQHNRRTA